MLSKTPRVISSKARNLAGCPGKKGILGETKVSFVATDTHFASALREILRAAQDDRDIELTSVYIITK